MPYNRQNGALQSTIIFGISLALAGSLSLARAAQSVTLAWDTSTSPTVAGYRLHYGTSTGNYTNTLDVGNSTSAALSNLTEGNTYYIAVTAYDGSDVESILSNEASFAALANQPPVVGLTSPAAGANYTSPASISLSASAADNDGSVARVEFYNGATKLGEDSTNPYTFTWSGVGVGSYSVSARAVDNLGAATTSTGINVTVTAPVAANPTGVQSVLFQPDGSVRITVAGTAGDSVSAYASSDLTNWSLLSSAINGTGTLTINDPAAINLDQRFYRVSANGVMSAPAGFTKQRVTGITGSQSYAESYFGIRYGNAVLHKGTVSSDGTQSITDNSATWSNNQFNGANGAHYLEITSGPRAGLSTDITGTNATSKTLTTDDDLSPLLTGGEAYQIRKHHTLASLFGANNEAGLKSGTSSSGSDDVRIFNPVTQKLEIYYFKTGGTGGNGWRASTDSSVDVSTRTLYADQGLIIRRRAAGDLKVKLSGAVKTGPTIIPVGLNSNLVANVYPAGNLTLANSGLYTGDANAALAGASSLSGADEVRIWNGTTLVKYFYKTSGTGGIGWRKSTNTSVDASATQIPAGAAFYIVRKKSRPAFNWTAQQPF